MNLRFAHFQDLKKLDPMLRDYLHEQREAGSPVLPTQRTFNAYRDMARAYLSGSLFGVLVLAEDEGTPVGFVLAGENTSGGTRFDTSLGKVAYVWLVWVAPHVRKHGVGLSMLSFGRPRLVELGFNVAAMTVREDNTEGQALTLAFGASPTEREFLFDLAEKPHHG